LLGIADESFDEGLDVGEFDMELDCEIARQFGICRVLDFLELCRQLAHTRGADVAAGSLERVRGILDSFRIGCDQGAIEIRETISGIVYIDTVEFHDEFRIVADGVTQVRRVYRLPDTLLRDLIHDMASRKSRIELIFTAGTQGVAELGLGVLTDVVLDTLPESGVVADALAFGANGYEPAERLNFFQLAAEYIVLGANFQELFLNEEALRAELAKHVNLAAQQVRFDGLKEIVNSARVVALKNGFFFAASGRQENDWDIPCAFVTANAFGRLKAVHTVHVHVEYYQGDSNVLKDAQGFFPPGSHQDVTIGRFEKARGVAQIGGAVIDNKNGLTRLAASRAAWGRGRVRALKSTVDYRLVLLGHLSLPP